MHLTGATAADLQYVLCEIVSSEISRRNRDLLFVFWGKREKVWAMQLLVQLEGSRSTHNIKTVLRFQPATSVINYK